MQQQGILTYWLLLTVSRRRILLSWYGGSGQVKDLQYVIVFFNHITLNQSFIDILLAMLNQETMHKRYSSLNTNYYSYDSSSAVCNILQALQESGLRNLLLVELYVYFIRKSSKQCTVALTRLYLGILAQNSLLLNTTCGLISFLRRQYKNES